MPDVFDRWMTAAELAEHIQLSRAKIFAMTQAAEIPCTKMAGRSRFFRTEIDAWKMQRRPAVLRPPQGDREGW